MYKKNTRLDRTGTHRTVYESNRKKILKTQSVCGICGKPVDKSLKPPHPLAPVIDHIIPLNKGGHPSDIKNLQLAHASCNRTKSDNLYSTTQGTKDEQSVGNRNLPHTIDWLSYK